MTTDQHSDSEQDGGEQGGGEEFERVRVVVEVVAGLIPQRPDPEHTRRYALTTREWEEADDQVALLAELNGRAMGYAGSLMLQPDRLNWVSTTWLWP